MYYYFYERLEIHLVEGRRILDRKIKRAFLIFKQDILYVTFFKINFFFKHLLKRFNEIKKNFVLLLSCDNNSLLFVLDLV